MLKNKKIIMLIMLVLGLILIFPVKSNAANASITCSTSGEVDKPITIKVSGTGVQWNLELKVDGQTIAKNSELDNYEANKNISFSGTYTPKEAGSKKVTLEGTVTEFSNGSTIRSFESKTITIQAKEVTPTPEPEPDPTPTPEPTPEPDPTPKEEAKITKIVVGGQTVKNPSQDFTLTFENNVSSVDITATVNNGESYTINDGTNKTVKLEEGTNRVVIKLSSGKQYLVFLRRLPKQQEETKPNVIEEEPKEEVPEVKLGLNSLEIEGFELSPEFSAEVYAYNLEIGEDVELTSLKVDAVANKEDASIEIVGNEEIIDGENIITVIVKSKDEKETVTYQIVVNKIAKTVDVVAPVTEEQKPVEEEKITKTQKIAITVIAVIAAIAGIIFGVIEYIHGKNKNEDEEEIPYAKIGFEKEDETKVEETKKEVKENEDKEAEEIEEKPIKKPRGKHF